MIHRHNKNINNVQYQQAWQQMIPVSNNIEKLKQYLYNIGGNNISSDGNAYLNSYNENRVLISANTINLALMI